MWSVYYWVGTRWVRLTQFGYAKATAVRTFQSVLLGATMSGIRVELRKMRDRDLVAEHIVEPAYGRTYDSDAAILADWESGKDFLIRNTQTYLNKADALKHRTFGNGVLVLVGSQLTWIPYPKEGVPQCEVSS